MLKKLLRHPLTRNLDVDDPRTTSLRRQIVANKPFLRSIYSEWYSEIVRRVDPNGRILEIGSGAGFLDEYIPGVITSEVFCAPGLTVNLVCDGRQLPFESSSLDAIVMTDVLHHIPNIDSFLSEAIRCIRPLGKIVMIEPWRTAWSEWVYKHLHHEPFETSSGWQIPKTGPLSGANGALPWILFKRDKDLFERQFPELKITEISPIMPMTYLLSGGISWRCSAPSWSYKFIRTIERLDVRGSAAMFAIIEISRA